MAKTTIKVRENVYESIYSVVYTLQDFIETVVEDYPEARCSVKGLCNGLWDWKVDETPEGKNKLYSIDLEKLEHIGAVVADIKTQIGK